MVEPLINDPRLRVRAYAATQSPQRCCYLDMHTDYSEHSSMDEFFEDGIYDPYKWLDPFNPGKLLSESDAGSRVINHCLRQKHWGILEGPSISLAVDGYSHTVMQQARTHRVGITFNVQSGRYTGKRLYDYAEGNSPDVTLEDLFYVRPVGLYTDRQGKKYEVTEDQRTVEFEYLEKCVQLYAKALKDGRSEEHARETYIPYCIRQNWTVTYNIRSLFHFLDMRTPLDAQLEIRDLCHKIWPYITNWIPELAEFYYEKRWSKNNLAP